WDPDRVVGLDDDVMRRVERLAVEPVDERRDGAVVFGARHAPCVMLAGDEPPLPVAGIAVGVIGGLAVDARVARHLVPAQDAIVYRSNRRSAHRRNRPAPPTSARRWPAFRRPRAGADIC